MIRLLRKNISPVVIDNTNVTYWEVKNYLTIAKEYDYLVFLVEPQTPFKFDVDKLYGIFNFQIDSKL